MNWTSELSVGNNEIDNEHKKLIEVINDLIDISKPSYDRKEFARILSEMTDYSLKHMIREEGYMKKIEYKNYDEHKHEHDKYRYKVAMYNVNFKGKNHPDPKEVTEYLKLWWKDHILKYDISYEKFKTSKGLDIKY